MRHVGWPLGLVMCQYCLGLVYLLEDGMDVRRRKAEIELDDILRSYFTPELFLANEDDVRDRDDLRSDLLTVLDLVMGESG
jgi:hypothetical protein